MVLWESIVTQKSLIYECVSNGNFQTYLSGEDSSKVFNWSQRLAVLVSIAKAIHFLHTGMIPGFFKNRLKTNNILLSENWMAKLSDYGLSIISEENYASGGKGESPNSWQMKNLEDDVYSFGFILLEALVGPSVSAKREASVLSATASFNTQDGWKQIVDPVVQATCCKESLLNVISITSKCISPSRVADHQSRMSFGTCSMLHKSRQQLMGIRNSDNDTSELCFSSNFKLLQMIAISTLCLFEMSVFVFCQRTFQRQFECAFSQFKCIYKQTPKGSMVTQTKQNTNMSSSPSDPITGPYSGIGD